jgi:hypothetical protein
MPRAKVLPVPARPTTRATPWPPWHRSRPSKAVQPLHPVGDDQMGVQQRIALTGGPVINTDR